MSRMFRIKSLTGSLQRDLQIISQSCNKERLFLRNKLCYQYLEPCNLEFLSLSPNVRGQLQSVRYCSSKRHDKVDVSTQNASQSNSSNEEEDFYGITQDEKLNITSGAYHDKVDTPAELAEKFPFRKKEDGEPVISTPFGTVRFDDEKVTKRVAFYDDPSSLSCTLSGASNKHEAEHLSRKSLRKRRINSDMSDERLKVVTSLLQEKKLLTKSSDTQNFSVSCETTKHSQGQDSVLYPSSYIDVSLVDTQQTGESYSQFDKGHNENLNVDPAQSKTDIIRKTTEPETFKSDFNEFDHQYFADQIHVHDSSIEKPCDSVDKATTVLKDSKSDFNEFDQQYFEDQINTQDSSIQKTEYHAAKTTDNVSANASNKVDAHSVSNYNRKLNGQYLPDETRNHMSMPSLASVNHLEEENMESLEDLTTTKRGPETTMLKNSESDFSEFDKQYFADQIHTHDCSIQKPEYHAVKAAGSDIKPSLASVNHLKEETVESVKDIITNQKGHETVISGEEVDKDSEKQVLRSPGTHVIGDTVYHIAKTKRQERKKQKIVANTENPETAYDYAIKLRKEGMNKSTGEDKDPEEENVQKQERRKQHKSVKGHWHGKLDAKGFRILTNQVEDLKYLPEDIVTYMLRDSVLYDHGGIVAIDKPYGLASHGGPGQHHSVGKQLPKLAKLLDPNLETLHLIHRLDKETTGVMLLARSEEVAREIHQMFIKREVIKRYWVLTKGVPNPVKGVIDIPLVKGTVGDKYRMTLRPHKVAMEDLGLKAKTSDKWSQAVTKYEVLDENSGCALIECEPATGVKHQIRCHLAFGLNTPILGDHKYSHHSKMAPQKLYPEILRSLGIRQTKARHLAMHLHAKSIILPGFLDGRNLFISARLPHHFKQNMKWLKINPPR